MEKESHRVKSEPLVVTHTEEEKRVMAYRIWEATGNNDPVANWHQAEEILRRSNSPPPPSHGSNTANVAGEKKKK